MKDLRTVGTVKRVFDTRKDFDLSVAHIEAKRVSIVLTASEKKIQER
jgi:hypothetical protein